MEDTWANTDPFGLPLDTAEQSPRKKRSTMPTPPARKPQSFEEAANMEEAMLRAAGLDTSPLRNVNQYQSLKTAGSGNRPEASARNISLPPLAVKDRVPPKKPLRPALPPRTVTSAPAEQTVQATNGISNGSKVTYQRPVRKTTGEVVNVETTIVILESDIRKIMFLAEYDLATRTQLVELDEVSDYNRASMMDKLRKRLKMLMDAGIVQMEGQDQGALTLYGLTPTGRELCPDSFTLRGADVKAEDEAVVLNRATLAIQFIAPKENPTLAGLVKPLPVVSRNRIMADSRDMNAGKANREQQNGDLHDWLTPERDARGATSFYGYPTVGPDWTYGDMDEQLAVRIDNFFRKGVRAKDGTILKPSYLFNTFDENGRAENLIDYVTALPHMRVPTARGTVLLPQCMANVLALVNQTDAYWQTMLGKIANSTLGYSKLIVWVPNNISIARAVEHNWDTLKLNNFIPTGREDMLQVQTYDPLNANKDEYSMYRPDVAGKAAKHYFKG